MRNALRNIARTAVCCCTGLLACAAAGAGEPVRLFFGLNHGTWARFPSADVAYDPQIDLEESTRGGALVVRVDLDGNGAKEIFVRTACDNGGCEYPVFRGPSGTPLGAVFGSAVWILERKVNGLPEIRTYSRVQADLGTVGRYEFDGKAYRLVGTTEIGPDEGDALFRALAQVPKP
jgi:hypothetical protein